MTQIGKEVQNTRRILKDIGRCTARASNQPRTDMGAVLPSGSSENPIHQVGPPPVRPVYLRAKEGGLLMFQYHVDAFVPPASGCGKPAAGWDPKRCAEFAMFLNRYAADGWKLHSCEYRQVQVSTGCGSSAGSWLVCVFERGS
jgi:hypothetical protein